MSRAVAVLRPEPGNGETVARIAALGLMPIAIPLFEVRALRWAPPDPAAHDALLLTSANAVRMAGDGLRSLAGLPVLAVGGATAEAARTAGLNVIATGTEGVESLVALSAARGIRRALHLAGRDHKAAGAAVSAVIAVYESVPREIDRAALESIDGGVALLHSPRAARRFDALAREHALDRTRLALAALSSAVAGSAGTGWESVAAAASPDESALLALARRLAD